MEEVAEEVAVAEKVARVESGWEGTGEMEATEVTEEETEEAEGKAGKPEGDSCSLDTRCQVYINRGLGSTRHEARRAQVQWRRKGERT